VLTRLGWLAPALWLGCANPIGRLERAITHGADDDGDPAVAALLDESGTAYCTATLITPNALITAAHCLDGIQPSSVYFGAAPGTPDAPAADGLRIPVASTQMQPEYDPDTHANDVGLVVLAMPPGIDPAPIYSRAFDRSFVGMTIRLVGFGATSALDSSAPRKRVGSSRIARYDETEFSFGPSPSQTCFGDSGGPAFGEVGGVEYLLGVTSNGDPSCSAGGTDVRVGAFEAGFIEGYLANRAAPPTVVGGCSAAPGAPGGVALGALAIALVALGRASRPRRDRRRARAS
jgi:hypothetical protein